MHDRVLHLILVFICVASCSKLGKQGHDSNSSLDSDKTSDSMAEDFIWVNGQRMSDAQLKEMGITRTMINDGPHYDFIQKMLQDKGMTVVDPIVRFTHNGKEPVSLTLGENFQKLGYKYSWFYSNNNRTFEAMLLSSSSLRLESDNGTKELKPNDDLTSGASKSEAPTPVPNTEIPTQEPLPELTIECAECDLESDAQNPNADCKDGKPYCYVKDLTAGSGGKCVECIKGEHDCPGDNVCQFANGIRYQPTHYLAQFLLAQTVQNGPNFFGALQPALVKPTLLSALVGCCARTK